MIFYLPPKIFDVLLHWMTFLFTTILFLLMLSSANAYDVVMAWDPNSEPDLSGYILYVDDGTSELPYEHFATYSLEEIDSSNPTITIADLQDDKDYYFVMTAYDTAGNESDYSEEICVMNGQKCPENMTAANNGVAEDVGTVAEDAGTVAEDAGTVAEDAGTVAEDVGSVAEDVGSVAEDVGSVAEDVGSVAEDVGSVAEDVGSVAEDVGGVADNLGASINNSASDNGGGSDGGCFIATSILRTTTQRTFSTWYSFALLFCILIMIMGIGGFKKKRRNKSEVT